MKRRLVVYGGLLASEEGLFQADLVIEGERIESICHDASRVECDERIDVSGLIVFPGFIDVHTHFKDPSDPPSEGFKTGSAGAVAGGVTSVVEMPQASPTSSKGAHIVTKIAVGEAESIVDFGLWGGVTNQDAADIDEMLDLGIAGLKAFMASSSETFPRVTDANLFDVLTRLANTDIPIGVHAENDDMVTAGINRLQTQGRADPLAHAQSRPPMVEIEAINRALLMAEQAGGHVFICHCSTVGGLNLIRQARSRGVRVTVETCPQYLVLNEDDLVRLGPYGRCAPAIRSQQEVEGIWDYVADGTIDMVSSDHCGYSTESKDAGLENIWAAPLGLSGIQTTFPLLYDEMLNNRGLQIGDFVRLASSNPARTFGLFPRKGTIQVGADADIVLFDPNRTWTIHGRDMVHRHKWTPYDGRELRGKVIRTIRRGETVYLESHDPALNSHAGTGRFLPFGYGEELKISTTEQYKDTKVGQPAKP